MLVFYGHGEEFRPIAHAGIEQCPVCNQFFNFHIYEDSAYFTLYFVPVAGFAHRLPQPPSPVCSRLILCAT